MVKEVEGVHLWRVNEPCLDFLKPPLPFKAVSVLSRLRKPLGSIEEKIEEKPNTRNEEEKFESEAAAVGGVNVESEKSLLKRRAGTETGAGYGKKKNKGADLKIRSK